MGNAPSKGEAVRSDVDNVNDGLGVDDEDGGGENICRLPTSHRGGRQRDAFLPVDDVVVVAGGGGGNDDVGMGRGHPPPPLPPPLPPRPSPTLHSPGGGSAPMMMCSIGPPSVSSTSCDSSYATQDVSPLSGGPYNEDGGVYSTTHNRGYPSSQFSPDISIATPTRTNKTVPRPRQTEDDDGGLFDCVKSNNVSVAAISPPPSPSLPSTTSPILPGESTEPFPSSRLPAEQSKNIPSSHHGSSPSLTSLFGACMRSSDANDDEDDNEYANMDLKSCSDHDSHQGGGGGNRRNAANYPLRRQISAGSASSQVSSVYSHNSYCRNDSDHGKSVSQYGSRSSLLSAFSSSSNASTSQRQRQRQRRPSQHDSSSFLFTEDESNMQDGDMPTYDSDMGRVRTYHVVTTAALPWMTGTAVNPLLRAAHLVRRNRELLRRRGGGEELERKDGWVREVGGDCDGNDDVSPINTEPASPTEVATTLDGARGGVMEALCWETRNEEGNQVGKDGSALTTMDNLDQMAPSPPSPCSLDYSCLSLAEVGDASDDHSTTATCVIDDNPRVDGATTYGSDVEMGKEDSFFSCFSDAVSPLGDSFLHSPITSPEITSSVDSTLAQSQHEVDKSNEKLGQVTLVIPSRVESKMTQSQQSDDVSNEKLGQVSLVIPWLTNARDRIKLYGPADVIRDLNDKNTQIPEEEEKEGMGNKATRPKFATQEEQEAYIRSWLANDAGMPEEAKELKILFYPARFHKFYNSIFALGDICDLIPDKSADVCILEEPEHLNWYRAPGCPTWSSKFAHCVGIIHTNYKAYAREHAPAGFLAAPLLAGVNSMVVQANCHRVVKLSGVLQEFAPLSECIENVHGIRETFLKEGERRRKMSTTTTTTTTTPVRSRRRIYFIGKLLWAKGFDQLLELESSYRDRSGDFFEIDIFGSGPDELEIKRAFSGGVAGVADDNGSGILYSLNKKWSSSDLNKKWSSSDLHRKLSSTDLHLKWSNSRRQRLPANFNGKVDHSALAGDEYLIFVNPSLTEVLCTTTAEAIAMGKWAIVPSHPSNAFFVQFPNCLSYRNRREFVSTLRYALNNDPPHLSDELSSLLSWEAATARCVSAAAVSKREESRNCRFCRAKEEKTLKSTLSGLINSVCAPSSSPTSSEASGSVGACLP